MSPYLLVLTSVSDEKVAEKMAKGLVENRLAACVTVSALGRSFYWWDDQIADHKEFVLIIKTKQELYAKVERRIQDLHSYELPEIIAVPIDKGYEKYLRWMDEETKS